MGELLPTLPGDSSKCRKEILLNPLTYDGSSLLETTHHSTDSRRKRLSWGPVWQVFIILPWQGKTTDTTIYPWSGSSLLETIATACNSSREEPSWGPVSQVSVAFHLKVKLLGLLILPCAPSDCSQNNTLKSKAKCVIEGTWSSNTAAAKEKEAGHSQCLVGQEFVWHPWSNNLLKPSVLVAISISSGTEYYILITHFPLSVLNQSANSLIGCSWVLVLWLRKKSTPYPPSLPHT